MCWRTAGPLHDWISCIKTYAIDNEWYFKNSYVRLFAFHQPASRTDHLPTRKRKIRSSIIPCTMPACCLGSDCKNKQLELRSGHKCRLCRKPVHSINCSIVDETRQAHENLVCLQCNNKNSSTSPADTTAEQEPKRISTKGDTRETSKKTKKGTSSEKRSSATGKKKDPPKRVGRVEKITKTPTQKLFVLQSDETTPDPLCLKTVCFDVNDNKYGTQLAIHLFPEDTTKLLPSLKHYDGSSYLFGTITGPTKKKVQKVDSTTSNGRTIH